MCKNHRMRIFSVRKEAACEIATEMKAIHVEYTDLVAIEDIMYRRVAELIH